MVFHLNFKMIHEAKKWHKWQEFTHIKTIFYLVNYKLKLKLVYLNLQKIIST